MNKSKNRKKVGIYLPDGVGIRNYIYSGLVAELQKQGNEVVLYHNLGKEFASFINNEMNVYCQIVEIPAFKESNLLYLLREAICYARLITNYKKTNNETILSNHIVQGSFYRKTALYISQFLGRIVSFKYEWILNAEKVYNKKYKKYLLNKEEFNFLNDISSLICLHQRALNAIPLFLIAEHKGIKRATIIYSWDNLPKARLNIQADLYFVWSDYMKDEMKLYYPEIVQSKIIVSSTPQFAFYDQPQYIKRKHIFYNEYQIPENVKCICFSGDDKLTSPYDDYYLEQLLKAINELGLKNNIWVIFRPCPADTEERYIDVINSYQNIRIIKPLWSNNCSWNLKIPYFSDVKLLYNIIAHSIGVINIGSTMAIDFGICGKPAAYFNYDPPYAKKWSVRTIYKLQHFQTLNGLDPVQFVNDYEALKKWIVSIANNGLSQKHNSDMRKWISKICCNKETNKIISINL